MISANRQRFPWLGYVGDDAPPPPWDDALEGGALSPPCAWIL